jgi:RNA polymerase sigma-70 factor (ECF subfamily)
MDEAQILFALQADDKNAWDLLYDLLYKKVYFFTRTLIDEKMEAEDIATQALVKFWAKGPEHFDTFLQVKDYIFKTAKHAALDALDKAKVQKRRQLDLVYLAETVEANFAERAEQARYKAEMQQLLYDEIEKLPPQCREAVKLVYIGNLPRAAVAERLHITISTVNNHIAHARSRLRQLFSEKELMILLLLLGCCPN